MPPLTQRFGTTAANSRYIKHPAEGWSQDGDPVDAGTAQILDQNTVHLAYESVRHLVACQGPNDPGKSGDPNGYNGLIDASKPAGTLSDYHLISWDRTTASRFGPFFTMPDQAVGSSDTVIFRPIRVAVYCKAGATNSLKLAAAMVPPRTTPRDVGHLAFAGWTAAATSDGWVTLNLIPRAPVTSATIYENERARKDSGTGAFSIIYPYYLYIGWYSSDSADRVYTLSAWESREITVT